jgi:hypothetical protein
MFFHQSGTIAVAQYGEENLVSISAAKMSIPYGPLIVWKALDWDQFEFALRGHLSNAFYDSPRATTEHELQEKGMNNNLMKTLYY